MTAEAIVGANWGDEGKGKLVDFLAGQADIVVRFHGGKNAGHTIINSLGKHVLRMLPSGVFYPNVLNVIGTGAALDVPQLMAELEMVKSKGVMPIQLAISDRAQIVLPYHILQDEYEEERLGAAAFGSTKSGIAPFYSDKYLKIGIRVSDLFSLPTLKRRVETALTIKNSLFQHLYRKSEMCSDQLIKQLRSWAEKIRPYVTDCSLLLNKAYQHGNRILFEGQLGALRDPDHGIYPYVTSSSTLSAYAGIGGGLTSGHLNKVIAVAKAYSTCVGEGPFVTELDGEKATRLRKWGADDGEYGAATGRPRRVGYFDAVATRYGCQLQNTTEVALTCLDVLGYLDRIPICVGYQINGKKTNNFPTTPDLQTAKPVYDVLPGWRCDISHINNYRQLPSEAKAYIRRVESLIGYPIGWVSIGPHREAMIRKSG